jgi:hypothetical protein
MVVVIVFNELFCIFIDYRICCFFEQHIEFGLNGDNFVIKRHQNELIDFRVGLLTDLLFEILVECRFLKEVLIKVVVFVLIAISLVLFGLTEKGTDH